MPSTTTRSNAYYGRLASERQVNFARDLLDRKNLLASPKFFDRVNAMDQAELDAYVESIKNSLPARTSRYVSKMIDALKVLPDREDRRRGQVALDNLPDVPAGHYAVTGEDGTTDFYRVDRPTEGRWAGRTFVKLQLSEEYRRVGLAQARTVLSKILDAGVQEAMVRYGLELGRCGACNTTLTNEVSRKLGIGPVCRRRMGWA